MLLDRGRKCLLVSLILLVSTGFFVFHYRGSSNDTNVSGSLSRVSPSPARSTSRLGAAADEESSPKTSSAATWHHSTVSPTTADSLSGTNGPKSCPYLPPSSAQAEAAFTAESIDKLRAVAARFDRRRPVVLMVSGSKGGYLAVNWLCAARNAISNFMSDNVVVVASDVGDSHLADLLTSNGLNGLQMLFKCEATPDSSDLSFRLRTWQRALTLRTLVVMLLTHWGVDVFVTDPDALLVGDPFPVFSHIIQSTGAHIIGQKGHMPTDVASLWGFSLVLGSIYYRSSSSLDPLWREMFMIQFRMQTSPFNSPTNISKLRDDQKLLNKALVQLDVRWKESPGLYNSSSGQSPSGLQVAALDVRYSFRGDLSLLQTEDSDTSHLLVLHPATLGHLERSKIKQLQSMNLIRMSVTEKKLWGDFISRKSGKDQFFKDVCSSKGIEL